MENKNYQDSNKEQIMTTIKEMAQARKKVIAEKRKEMAKFFKDEYLWLLENYHKSKFMKTNYHPISIMDFKDKKLTDYFEVFRQLYIAVGKEKFSMFLEFTKNTNICSFIKRIIDENGGIVAGNSYIVISNNNEILNNIATWIIFELTDINSNLMINNNILSQNLQIVQIGGIFTILVGEYANKEDAENVKQKLSENNIPVRMTTN